MANDDFKKNNMTPDENDENASEENYDLNDFYPDDDTLYTDEPLDEDTVVFTPEKQSTVKAKNGKLTKGQKIAIFVILFIYVFIISVAAWLIYYKPSTGQEEVPFDTTEEVSQDEIPVQTAVVNGGFNEEGHSYNILLVGHDKLAHLADVTMIVNCNTKENTVTVVQIPRDTYVGTESSTGKINAVFATMYNTARMNYSEDAYMDTLEAYTSLLEKNLCINIHQTVIVDLEGFKNIVDSVDGVDVWVPNDMYYSDPEQDLYISIPAGLQHLDGANAEGFVRFRSGYVQADLGRVNAQKIFLTAFFNKIKSTVKSVDVATLKNLINTALDNVHTDMSASDIMYYAKFALKVDLDNIVMMTLPGNVSGQYYVMNRETTLKAINNYFNVYNKEISDKLFDRNRVFCDDNSEYICNIYYADEEVVLDGEYRAEDIDENSINIQRN